MPVPEPAGAVTLALEAVSHTAG
jgi:hypothetical protein